MHIIFYWQEASLRHTDTGQQFRSIMCHTTLIYQQTTRIYHHTYQFHLSIYQFYSSPYIKLLFINKALVFITILATLIYQQTTCMFFHTYSILIYLQTIHINHRTYLSYLSTYQLSSQQYIPLSLYQCSFVKIWAHIRAHEVYSCTRDEMCTCMFMSRVNVCVHGTDL